jgi:hypothetical protein
MRLPLFCNFSASLSYSSLTTYPSLFSPRLQVRHKVKSSPCLALPVAHLQQVVIPHLSPTRMCPEDVKRPGHTVDTLSQALSQGTELESQHCHLSLDWAGDWTLTLEKRAQVCSMLHSHSLWAQWVNEVRIFQTLKRTIVLCMVWHSPRGLNSPPKSNA